MIVTVEQFNYQREICKRLFYHLDRGLLNMQVSGAVEIVAQTWPEFQAEIAKVEPVEPEKSNETHWAAGFRAPGHRGNLATSPKGKTSEGSTIGMNDTDEGRGFWPGAGH